MGYLSVSSAVHHFPSERLPRGRGLDDSRAGNDVIISDSVRAGHQDEIALAVNALGWDRSSNLVGLNGHVHKDGASSRDPGTVDVAADFALGAKVEDNVVTAFWELGVAGVSSQGWEGLDWEGGVARGRGDNEGRGKRVDLVVAEGHVEG